MSEKESKKDQLHFVEAQHLLRGEKIAYLGNEWTVTNIAEVKEPNKIFVELYRWNGAEFQDEETCITCSKNETFRFIPKNP